MRLQLALNVKNLDEAVAFYAAVFGAEERERYVAPNGHVIHVGLSIRGADLTLAEAHEDWYPEARPDGSPILLTVLCDDPDAVAAAAETNGGTILIPVDDRFYGRREGRIRDPFGHLWIVSKLTDDKSAAQIQKAIDAMGM